MLTENTPERAKRLADYKQRIQDCMPGGGASTSGSTYSAAPGQARHSATPPPGNPPANSSPRVQHSPQPQQSQQQQQSPQPQHIVVSAPVRAPGGSRVTFGSVAPNLVHAPPPSVFSGNRNAVAQNALARLTNQLDNLVIRCDALKRACDQAIADATARIRASPGSLIALHDDPEIKSFYGLAVRALKTRIGGVPGLANHMVHVRMGEHFPAVSLMANHLGYANATIRSGTSNEIEWGEMFLWCLAKLSIPAISRALKNRVPNGLNPQELVRHISVPDRDNGCWIPESVKHLWETLATLDSVSDDVALDMIALFMKLNIVEWAQTA